MSNNAVTAAPFPLDLYEDVPDGNGGVRRDKVTLRLSPLNDVSISEMDNWVQTHYIAMARRAARGLPQEEREREIDIAQRRAAMISAFSGEGARMVATIDGMTMLCWLSVSPNHKDITPERLRALLINPANLQEANAMFRAANVPAAAAQPVANPNKKKQRKGNAPHRKV